MKKKPYISIITPNLNNGKYLEDTIRSVISQNMKNFEYVVIDGKSNDNSLEIIKKYKNFINYFESKKDKSNFHAVHKGIIKSKGEVIIWINSGDLLDSNATKNISEIFKKKRNIKWINGRCGYIKKNFKFSLIPYLYPRQKILNGMAHKKFWGYIQQESVSFRKSLYIKSKGLITKKNYASDYFLWKKFAMHENLETFFIKIGYFRTHPNQLSSIKNHYEKSTGHLSNKTDLNLERLLFSVILLPLVIIKTLIIKFSFR
tara:strand:- start:470 stop:1246 length:777 start_codon:yes stop_codon:yes gene_type:complete